MTKVSISAGRDYNTYDRYEYVVFDGETIVARRGCYSTKAAAKRDGIKAAQAYIQAEG